MRLALAERITAAQAAHLSQIGRVASDLGLPAYLVGGPVRDAFLCRGSLDVDVMVEGDAARLAEALAAFLGGHLTRHERFGTAVIELPDWHLDVATARSEHYPRPGALPVVLPATAAEDLRRRDFSYNAVALRLDRDLGLVVDPLHGLADLRRGVTRALHASSFVDDPTRIIRAARYAARLGCRLDPATQHWLAEAVCSGALATVTGQRVWGELERLLAEPTAPEAVALLGCWGVLERLGLTAATAGDLRLLHVAQGILGGATNRDRAWAALGLLAGPAMAGVVTALGLSAAEAAGALAAATVSAEPPVAAFAASVKNSTLYNVLSPLPQAALLAVWARHPGGRPALQRLRTLAPDLDMDGHDLEREGFAPSAGFRCALEAAREARLDAGAGRDGQLAAARRALAAWQNES